MFCPSCSLLWVINPKNCILLQKIFHNLIVLVYTAQKARGNLHIYGSLLITWHDNSNSAKIHLTLMKLSGADPVLLKTVVPMQQSVCALLQPIGSMQPGQRSRIPAHCSAWDQMAFKGSSQLKRLHDSLKVHKCMQSGTNPSLQICCLMFPNHRCSLTRQLVFWSLSSLLLSFWINFKKYFIQWCL